MKRRYKRRALYSTGGILLIAVLAFFGYAFFGGNQFPQAAQRAFFVSKGDTFPTVTDSLEVQGLIRSRFLFVLVARILGGTDRIQVGKYLFATGVSNAEIFLSLRSGSGNSLILVSIPEGLRTRQQARIYARTLGIDSARYVALSHDPYFIRKLGIDDSTLQGYLIPDSYAFYWQQNEEDVLRRMTEQFRKFYADSLVSREKSLRWTTRQVLTLASIVEGEAVHEEERATIAGVYLNRLRRGMKLEADPTIQYILNETPRRLLYSDLRVDHPYNTYQRAGLPPGPVNNPGRASILASLYPEAHNYLFFVADGRGGHRFAATYSEHLRNVRLYRRLRSQRRG